MVDDRKIIALAAVELIKSNKFGKIVPHLDSEFGVQMTVNSKLYLDIAYQFIVNVEHKLTVGVYRYLNDGWRYVKPQGKIDWDEYKSLYEYFEYEGYAGIEEEYRLIEDTIKKI